MNIKQIKSKATNHITFERGVDYYENGYVQNYHFNASNYVELSAEVIGSLNNIYQVSASINEFEELVDCTCQCQAFNTYKGCCKHIIALLLTYYYDTSHRPKLVFHELTKTDKIAAKMISKYTNKSISGLLIESSNKNIQLIPKLEIDYNKKLKMSFMIGHERPYVLRNISKFFYDMNDNNLVEYGKNLTFYHHIDQFNNDSKALVKYLLNNYYEYQFYNTNKYSYSNNHDLRYLLISPSALDKFFDIYINKQIILIDNYIENKILLLNENPDIVLKIKPQGNDAYNLFVNFKEAIFLKGEKYEYIYIKQILYRLNDEYSENVGILLKSLMEKGSSLVISQSDMSTFYVNVLCEIQDFITIETEDADLSIFEPTPLITKVFIDMETSNLVTAKLKFVYGDYELDPFDDVKSDIYRNVKEELIAKKMMNQYFEDYNKEMKYFVISDDDMIFNLYVEGVDTLAKYMQIYVSDRFKNIIKKSPEINLGVKVNNHLLDITIDTLEFPIDELRKVLSSYKKNKKYYRLKDGTFVNLENNSLKEFSQITDGCNLSNQDLENKEVSIPIYRALYLDNILKNSEFIKSERDNYFKELVRDFKDVDDTTFIIPESLNQILRNYQKTGYRWLKTMSHYGFGGILADDMGLGKTIQMISLFQSYHDEVVDALPNLVVCPASLVLNWEMELINFAPLLKVETIIGTLSERRAKITKIDNFDVIITSYDYLKRDIDYYVDKKFMYHVIDEAQYIKNHQTLNAKSVKLVKSYCRFAMTGTPIENSLAEIWSIFDFIMPDYLYRYKKFNQDYEIPIVKDKNQKVLESLKKLVTPFVLRRLKKDVLKELPDKTETTMIVNLEGEQRKLYLANVALIKKEITNKNENGLNQNKIMILSMLTRLRQLCCDPSLYYENYDDKSAKLEMCLELIEASIGANHKILLFSQFTSMLAIIKDKLIEKNISFYLLQGSTKKEDRKKMVDNFNQDDTKVFLISLKAGGTGLNLTSADVVIHYDPWWNVSAQNQATDRTHRIGQKNNVTVYKLIAKDTIEEKILKLQEQKLTLADSIIVEDNGSITKMTEQEILDLFE